jgi:uncharacterized phage-associated protein
MKASELGRIVTHFINKKGDSVSHKKLQKLLYYIDAWHLVYFHYQIVDEDFEAWVHGPVIPSLYQELKEYGFNNIEVTNSEDVPDAIENEINSIIQENKLNEEQIELIETVLIKYGSLSSMELEMLSHSETPWIKARQGSKPNQPCKNKISKPKMKDFYASKLHQQ